jgi:hypothetical protein
MGRGPNFKKMNGPSGESNKKPTRLLGFSRIARPPYDDRCLLIFCEKFKSLFPLDRARCRMVWGLSSNPVNSNRSISLVIQRFLWREGKAKMRSHSPEGFMDRIATRAN